MRVVTSDPSLTGLNAAVALLLESSEFGQLC
jgi:hypothetical protein